jgi:hypothetical protein
VTLRGDGTWVAGALVATRLDATGSASLDPGRAALPVVRSLSRADFGDGAMRLTAAGGLLPP